MQVRDTIFREKSRFFLYKADAIHCSGRNVQVLCVVRLSTVSASLAVCASVSRAPYQHTQCAACGVIRR